MRRAITACGLLPILLCGCSGATAPPDTPTPGGEAGPLTVYTVNYPLRYFAERIGGEAVRVSFPAPPDVDPAYWSPPPEVIAAYQQADLVLVNGAGYAGWLDRATLRRSRVIDTSAGVREPETGVRKESPASLRRRRPSHRRPQYQTSCSYDRRH